MQQSNKIGYLKYISHYPQQVTEQIAQMIKANTLAEWFAQRHPSNHQLSSDKLLLGYTQDIKKRFLKKSAPLSKVVYDPKIHIVNNALGLHTKASRVQGSKLKAKREIRISELFRVASEPLLNMIVVHELAHLKEPEHSKAFYSLCLHMLPNYHQLEFEARIFLILKEI